MYKYLLWDIDGTVLDFKASERCAIKHLFKKYSLGDCSDDMIKLYSDINAKYWELLEKNIMTKKEILIGRFCEFFELVGIDKSIAESFNDDYQPLLGEYIVFVDEAEKLINLAKQKYTIVAVTNGTKVAQTRKLKNSGLNKVFDHIFISEDVGFEKPNINFFNTVFSTVGICDKKSALIIGDSLSSDMQGGVNAGIDTCWYNPEKKENTKNLKVNYEIESLKALYNILDL